MNKQNKVTIKPTDTKVIFNFEKGCVILYGLEKLVWLSDPETKEYSLIRGQDVPKEITAQGYLIEPNSGEVLGKSNFTGNFTYSTATSPENRGLKGYTYSIKGFNSNNVLHKITSSGIKFSLKTVDDIANRLYEIMLKSETV